MAEDFERICIVWVDPFWRVPCKPVRGREPEGSRGAGWHGPPVKRLKKGVKRKAHPIAATVSKRSAQSAAKKGYRNTVGRIRDVLGV